MWASAGDTSDRQELPHCTIQGNSGRCYDCTEDEIILCCMRFVEVCTCNTTHAFTTWMDNAGLASETEHNGKRAWQFGLS